MKYELQETLFTQAGVLDKGTFVDDSNPNVTDWVKVGYVKLAEVEEQENPKRTAVTKSRRKAVIE